MFFSIFFNTKLTVIQLNIKDIVDEMYHKSTIFDILVMEAACSFPAVSPIVTFV